MHLDMDYNEHPFDSPCLRRIVQGTTNLLPSQPRPERTPILRSLLIRLVFAAAIASEEPTDALVVNVAFTLAFAAFLRMGEFTYPSSALLDCHRLQQEHLTILCISLVDDHLILVLPWSNPDKFNRGITIRIAR